jgi:hypothetical protein
MIAFAAIVFVFLTAVVRPDAAKADRPLQPAAGALPDPTTPGPYQVKRSYYYAGNLQTTVTSPGANPSTNCPTGLQPGQSTHCPGQTFPQPLEGSVTWPANSPGPYKVLLIQHGRHTACKGATGTDNGSQIFSTGGCPNTTVPVSGPSGPELPGDIGSETGFWPSWGGYNYLTDLLASWGYVVISPSAGAIVTFDGTAVDAGAMSRAEIIANTLDLLYAWNDGTPAPAPTGIQVANSEPGIGTQLAGKLDFSHVAIMGHSRGGEGVTQFIEYNRQRPAPGRRYNLTGVFALAPIDRNKHFPNGTNFATLLPACDGDVSSINGANIFERGRFANVEDEFAKFQYYVEGANHNFYNTRWPSSDRSGNEAACGTSGASTATTIRLTPFDQRLTGIATMVTFLRVYGGGEVGMLPWLTDEVGYPSSACPVGPNSATVHLLAYCEDVVKTSYIAPASERQDVIRPDSGVKPSTADPTAPDSAGGKMTGTGFAIFDWCNPDPFANPAVANPPASQGTLAPQDVCESTTGSPTTQFNRSFGPQLALAWDAPATLSATLRGSARDVTPYRSLSMRASVQVGDVVRNPNSGIAQAGYDPRFASKDFAIALVDRDGNEKQIKLTDIYPGGLEGTLGAVTTNGQPRHEALNGFRIPIEQFEGSGVDLSDLDRVEIRFGADGTSQTGAIQFSTLAFQELADTPPSVFAAHVPLTPLPGDRNLGDVDGVVTGNPALKTPAGTCVDTAKPTTVISKLKKTGKLIKGMASDTGCDGGGGLSPAPGSIQRVQVSVAKSVKKGKCQYLSATGALLDPTTCAFPYSIIATGTDHWKVKPAKKLPKGRYTVVASAIDGPGNVSDVSTINLKVR